MEAQEKGFPMRSEQARIKLAALRRRNELLCRIDMWGFLIRQGVRIGAANRIHLNVDARAKYGKIIAVLVQIRLAGIENVSFLTEKP